MTPEYTDQLVDLIYAAMLGEVPWQKFVKELGEGLPDGRATLFFHDPAGGRGKFLLTSGINPQDVRAYNGAYHYFGTLSGGLGGLIHRRQCGHLGGGCEGVPARAIRMAWRTAGRLGLGGGPSVLFSPPRFSEAPVLEEGHGHHGHERVSVKPSPGSALEVIKAELLFHLLVGLLAGPARLDGGGEGLQVRFGGQVGEIVFPLAR